MKPLSEAVPHLFCHSDPDLGSVHGKKEGDEHANIQRVVNKDKP